MTDAPASDDGYTMSASVTHAIATLDALGLKRVHLVGHSRGAYVAAAMACARPDLAASCVIANTGTLAPGVDANHIVLQGAPGSALSIESQRWIFERSSYSADAVDDDWLREAVRLADLSKNRLALSRMADLYSTRFEPALATDKADLLHTLATTGMPCPTLVVWGRNDPLASAENGLMLFRLLLRGQTDTRWCLVNQAGHFVFREQPRTFNRVVNAFIERVAQAAEPAHRTKSPIC